MRDFLGSRAGKQFLLLSALAACLCLLGRQSPWLAYGTFPYADSTRIILLTMNVAGLMSFIYSALRIYDLRKEMAQHRQAELRADWTATHDHLTQLPNRYAFERLKLLQPERGEEETASTPTATVFSIDLDGFKKVNDLVGHSGGDTLLKEVSRRLSGFAPAGRVFRFGGDEFIVVAKDLPADKEDQYARLLIQLITRPIMIGGLSTQVGASVGYARWPTHGKTLEEVSHVSDVALYEAKASGTNVHSLFHPAMQDKVIERARFERKLRTAVSDNVIRPFYQPLVNLRTGSVCGFEALARWTDEDGKSISPQQFIGVAEETGMITALFQQLLLESCHDAQTWPEHVFLSCNISPVQMEDRLLASRILNICASAGLPPRRLEIEITENALIDDPELAGSIIDDLHAAGVRIALDDFGTGYSSLAQLARYKFDKIKIDKSFVSSSSGDDRHEKIVRAMIGLSRSLNIETTVEGIEQHTQLAYFVAQGCDIGQGYLFGKAMSAEDSVVYLDDHRDIMRSA